LPGLVIAEGTTSPPDVVARVSGHVRAKIPPRGAEIGGSDRVSIEVYEPAGILVAGEVGSGY
jgi:hypothetical protein